MAFYKALLPLESSLREAATSGRDDEVHYAFNLAFRFQSEGPAGLSVTRELTHAPLEAPGRISDDLSLELSQDAGGRRLRAGGPLHSREMPPFDAVLLIAFGGPQGPDDIRPFLANVLRGRNVPAGTGGRSCASLRVVWRRVSDYRLHAPAGGRAARSVSTTAGHAAAGL